MHSRRGLFSKSTCSLVYVQFVVCFLLALCNSRFLLNSQWKFLQFWSIWTKWTVDDKVKDEIWITLDICKVKINTNCLISNQQNCVFNKKINAHATTTKTTKTTTTTSTANNNNNYSKQQQKQQQKLKTYSIRNFKKWTHSAFIKKIRYLCHLSYIFAKRCLIIVFFNGSHSCIIIIITQLSHQLFLMNRSFLLVYCAQFSSVQKLRALYFFLLLYVLQMYSDVS